MMGMPPPIPGMPGMPPMMGKGMGMPPPPGGPVAPLGLPSAPIPGAVGGGPAAPVDVGEESLTLYVNNLNDKIHPDTLAKNLREVFGAFGEIQDLICMKSLRRRGQAWIVFKEQSAAGAAVKALQGFPFYNKPIRIAYAKAKSDVVSKADGTFQPRAKIKNKADRKANEAAQLAAAQSGGLQIGGNAAPPAAKMPDNTVPSNRLFVENLPPNTADQSLKMLFGQFAGFQDVRSIAGRNVAFADFTNEACAQQAMNAVQGFAITPQNSLKITFAR